MKVVAMIPIKLNSERVPGKNIKTFFDGTPLVHFIQKACLNAKTITETYIYCSNERIKEYLLPNVVFLKRPEFLDGNNANCNDIISEFIKTVESDIYVVSHATGPFTTSASIDACINGVVDGGFDSGFLGKRCQEFLWKDGKAMNFDVQNFPRTQDLPVLYEEAPGAYVFKKETFLKYNRRVGENVYIHETSDIESWDIDTPEDFVIADAIYKEVMLKTKKENI